MTTVYLAVGSNIGDRKENLQRAAVLLQEAGITIKKVSSIYETEPVDYLDQPWFFNGVLEAETTLRPRELLKATRAIETAMGSKKAFAKGPRLIDLDILLYGDQTMNLPELQVPHPRMLDRKFVMVPLVEIAPELRHPSWNGTAEEILANSTDRSVVRKLSA
ncbi:MAG TPA: 2-amino-4-hydroxy-6-hydroxymethyldihydropteridine diphosphokinase [Candidatus Acidoferrum sp.]|nr:2-amino-4-hydroxy-6-hydroxymethyldihydropteridine diphosphokinase [Candidatus Acidoferrum sp.]